MKKLLILSLVLNIVAICWLFNLSNKIKENNIKQSQMWKYQLYMDAKLSGQIKEND